jgi:hypothetical protein
VATTMVVSQILSAAGWCEFKHVKRKNWGFCSLWYITHSELAEVLTKNLDYLSSTLNIQLPFLCRPNDDTRMSVKSTKLMLLASDGAATPANWDRCIVLRR